MRSAPALSVIVPVCDETGTLKACLEAIRSTVLPGATFEIIVVNAASGDESAKISARYADIVIRLDGRHSGPAYARNRGAERASGELLAFIDATVRIRPDTLGRMLAILQDHPERDAVVACCDTEPAAKNFLSQYWNLLLHYAEQRHEGEGAHVVASCGIVRRETLLAAGMYDEWRFRTECLEGLDLGQRLSADGHPVIRSNLVQVTHLKRWSLGSLISEVWGRGVTLSRSLGYRRTRAGSPSEVMIQLSGAALPAIMAIGVFMLSAPISMHPPSWGRVVAGGIAFLTLYNVRVHRFFNRERGVLFAFFAAPIHILLQAVAVLALCIGWLLRDAIGDRTPDATTQALSELDVEMWPPVPRRR